MRALTILALGCALSAPAMAEDAASRPAVAEATLPSHTEVVLRLDQEVASDRARVGQIVPVSVARDVIVDGRVAIPRGTAGFGAVTARTGKGAFGKSGKLDIELRAIRVADRTVPIVGHYRATGKGRAGETIGTILVGGVIAGAFVTGRHAVFEEGREFTAYTGEATRVVAQTRTIAQIAGPAIAAPVARPVILASVAPAPVYRVTAYAVPAPHTVMVDPTGATDSRYDTLVRFERGLAAAQPVRHGDSRQGWKISD